MTIFQQPQTTMRFFQQPPTTMTTSFSGGWSVNVGLPLRRWLNLTVPKCAGFSVFMLVTFAGPANMQTQRDVCIFVLVVCIGASADEKPAVLTEDDGGGVKVGRERSHLPSVAAVPAKSSHRTKRNDSNNSLLFSL